MFTDMYFCVIGVIGTDMIPVLGARLKWCQSLRHGPTNG